jgi:putative hydrolase of the HAD superfamily
MTLKLLLFDLDETLAPDDTLDRALFDALAAEVGARYGIAPARLVAALDGAATSLWDRGEAAAYAMRIGISPWEGLWGPFEASDDPMLAALHRFAPTYRLEAWTAALAESGLAVDGLAETLAARFAVERHARQSPYPWSREVLELLRARYRLGMITNGAPDLQRLKLAGTGLAAFFDPLVISGDLGVGKPEPAIFAHALARAAASPSESVMIGDSWHRDVAGAVSAGLQAIWINPSGARPPAQHLSAVPVAADLRDVPGLLRALG